MLHKAAHSVDGMIGSLDCTHTFWKNCPKVWQGSYKGEESKPSIVMESVAEYFLFLWHASYGYTGTLNENTILFLDGTFHELEAEAGVVPFMIKEEQWSKVFVLVDGIYPSYSRFVGGIMVTATREEETTHHGRKGPGKM
jgi:hypothetical protein